jgi:predicted dehydrogenase
MTDRQVSRKPTDIDRRDFVKTSAAALGVTAVEIRPGRPPSYSQDETIRVGLVGCGGRGTGAAVQALNARANVKLVAMADAFEDRLTDSYETIANGEREDRRDLRRQIDVPPERRFVGFDAYREVIPLVDVVILTTPPGFRPMHFAAAVAAGKQVFMEKPVATDAPGIRSVLETAEEAKRKRLNVVVGLQRHYQTVYREWVDRLHAGMIGDITLGRVYWNSAGVWVRERKPDQTEMEYQMRNWYYFTWLCGDHIVEQHIHNIDVANWVKQGVPIRAQGQGGRLVRNGPDHGEIFDHHFVEFEYADGSRVLSQCRHIPDCWNSVTEAFHGTNGTAPEPGVILSRSGNTLFEQDDETDPNPYQIEHDELFEAITRGEYKYADAEMGAQATMTAIMGRMATYSGQVVTWEDALHSDLSLMPTRYAWDAKAPVVPDADGRYPIPTPGVTRAF